MWKNLKKMGKEVRGIHAFSRDVLCGGLQFTAFMYFFAGVFTWMAPYSADYLRTLLYADALLENAPAVLASTVIAALVSDLALRKTGKNVEK